MTAALVLFGRLILRPLLVEPIRAALTLFAVALGVAAIVAIDLAGQSAASSFHSSLEVLTGKDDLVITATGGLDELVLGKLAQLEYPFQLTPRIEDFATVNGRGEAIPFLGLDLVGAANNQALPVQLQAEQLQPETLEGSGDPVWVTGNLHLHAGDHIRLLINSRVHDFVVGGVLSLKGTGETGQKLIVADIGLAQIVTGKRGKLDSIYVQVPRDGSLAQWEGVLRKTLPAGAELGPRGARTDQNRKMLAAFRWNLHVLSYIALLVGAFLIYNTISISVVRRRPEIGVLRALGATRSAVLSAFLLEALLFGITGGLLGILLGRLMAIGASSLVGSTVQSLYVTSEPAPIQLTAGVVSVSLAIAAGISLLAALAPALEAAAVTPVAAMARGRWEFVNTMRARRTAPIAFIAFLLAGALTTLPPVGGAPVFGYGSVLLLVAGTSLLIPNIVCWSAALLAAALGRLLGVEAALAMRSLQSSLGRTSVLTAALATAIAMTAAVAIMVGSFRETVTVWLDGELTADFYLRPAGSAATDRHPTMTNASADSIEHIPGVAAVDRFRAYPITYDGLPATFAGSEEANLRERAALRFLPGEDAATILRQLPAGDFAIVSEPFANKHHVRPGTTIDLPLGGSRRQFRVLGVYYDYSTERGFVVVARSTLLKYLPDPALSSLAVYLKPGANASEVRQRIGDALSGEAVLVFSNGALRRGAIALFDQTFRITYALEAVAIAVAALGIASALLALVIDRRRDFAVLRFLGSSKNQVRRIILCEAGLLGLFANGIGIVLGTLLSLILIYVINKQSFGWTIQFSWPALRLAGMLGGIFAATVLAGLYPARIAMALNPIEAIHED